MEKRYRVIGNGDPTQEFTEIHHNYEIGTVVTVVFEDTDASSLVIATLPSGKKKVQWVETRHLELMEEG